MWDKSCKYNFTVGLNKQMRSVFTDIDNGLILEILPKRSKQTVIDFINTLPNSYEMLIQKVTTI